MGEVHGLGRPVPLSLHSVDFKIATVINGLRLLGRSRTTHGSRHRVLSAPCFLFYSR